MSIQSDVSHPDHKETYPVVPLHLGSFASSQAIIVGSLAYRLTKVLT